MIGHVEHRSCEHQKLTSLPSSATLAPIHPLIDARASGINHPGDLVAEGDGWW